jgi:hypothetical protein
MKMLTNVLAILVLSAGVAAAQDITGFHAANQPGMSPESSKRAPNPHPDLSPQVGGVFADGAKYGPTIISPTAPALWGNGEKYLSAPSTRYDLQHESGPAAHRQSGGLKLVSFEF